MITVNEYCRKQFGRKLYKIALDGGFTCPNRDGTLGTGGCIFCSGKGSGDFAQDAGLSVSEQIEEGKKLVRHKLPAGQTGPSYIAYFQAFTNTYAPVEKLRRLFVEAINHPDIAVLSVATRPDCLPRETLGLLAELNRIKPVWVELGLQTIHPETAAYIRRGYELPVYEQAADELQRAGIRQVITHVILGLPGETEEQMLETVRFAAARTDGLKLTMLHVLKGTELAERYQKGEFELMSMEEYIHLTVKCLEALSPETVIHRMTGDGNRQDLIAPLWTLDKKRVLNGINRECRSKK